jgi:hypothetical protein
MRWGSLNAGTGKTLTPTIGSLVINDGNGGNNYVLALGNNTTGVINPRPLTITAVPNIKLYDGTTSATAMPIITGGLVSGDRFTMFGQQYTVAQVGTGLTLVPIVAIVDGNGGANYALTLVNSATGDIRASFPAQLNSSQTAGQLNGDSASGGTCEAAAHDGHNAERTVDSGNLTSTPCVPAESRTGEQAPMFQIVSTGIRLPSGLTANEAQRQ